MGGAAQTAAPVAGGAPPAVQTPPAMQVAPDQKAFTAANALVDSGARAEGLRAFLRDYPQSKRVDRARSALLTLLLERQPQDVKEIHALAKARIAAAGKDERSGRENEVAFKLAEALPNGVDLKSAEAWARDAVRSETLAAVTARIKASAAKDKFPMPDAASLHTIWAETEGNSRQTLADVYLHQGKLDKSLQELDAAAALDQENGSVWTTRGQIAHAQHNDAAALDDLETAEVKGGVTPVGAALMMEIYARLHPGDATGLDAEIDRRYRALPTAFTPTPHTAAATGRTVLLELYTGSACAPCVAADLGVDGVLEAYRRDEVVALAFDQHIPEPDPLANADTVSRAKYNGVPYTPSFYLNGETLDIFGGPRSASKTAFVSLEKAIDASLKTPSGVVLHLTARLTPGQRVEASAEVRVTDEAALKAVLTAKAAPAAVVGPAAATPAAEKPAGEPKLLLNFALVQREVRYSGENGMRFHSMVVRSLAKPSTEGFAVAMTGQSTAAAAFDPVAVSASLQAYLAGFAQHSERFGTTHFLPYDTRLPVESLGVAAWVEDVTAHRVVAAAYLPVGGAGQETASR